MKRSIVAVVVFIISLSEAKCPASCGEPIIHVPASGGVKFTSPHFDRRTPYCPNLRCKWLLTTEPGHKLRVDFEYFDVDVSDGLYLYDGDQTSDTILKFLSGDKNHYLPRGIVSRSQSILASFTTNERADQTALGFRAAVTSIPSRNASSTPSPVSSKTTPIVEHKNPTPARLMPKDAYPEDTTTIWDWTTPPNPVCGALTRKVDGPYQTGRIQSPNYPMNYPEDTECVWVLSAPYGYRLNLTFDTFELQDYSDFLTVWAGRNKTEYSQLGRFTGSTIPYSITATTNEVTLRFESSYYARRGFSATFTASSGRDTGTFDMNDEHGALLQSPGYPNSFKSYTSVTYKISVEPWEGIRFDFKRFHTDSAGKVQIYRYHFYDDSDKIREYTGNFYDGSIIGLTTCTVQSTATFKFTADYTGGLGWSEPLGVLAYYTPISSSECIETVNVPANSAVAIAAYIIIAIIEVILFIIAIAVFVNERKQKQRATLAGYPNDTSIGWNTTCCLVLFILGLIMFMPFVTIIIIIMACVSGCQRRRARKARSKHHKPDPAPAVTVAVVDPPAAADPPAEQTANPPAESQKKKKSKKKEVSSSSSESETETSDESQPPTPKPRKRHGKHKRVRHARNKENSIVSGFVVNPALIPTSPSPAPVSSMYPSLAMEPQSAPVLAYPTLVQPAGYNNPVYHQAVVHSRPMSPVQQLPAVHQPVVQYVQQPVHTVQPPQVNIVQHQLPQQAAAPVSTYQLQAPPPPQQVQPLMTTPVYQQQVPVPTYQQQIQAPQPQYQPQVQGAQPVQPVQPQNPMVMQEGFQNQAPPPSAPHFPMTTMASYYGYANY